MPRDETAIVTLSSEQLSSFEESGFINSFNALDSFFDQIQNAIVKMDDNSLLEFIPLLDHFGVRAWYARVQAIQELENRIRVRLQKEVLTAKEFEEHVAKVVNVSRSTAYDDRKLFHKLKEHEITPRLDRTFYVIALRAPDFEKAVQHAEEENDRYHGKYSTREFARWVLEQSGGKSRIAEGIVNLTLREINIILKCLRAVDHRQLGLNAEEHNGLTAKMMNTKRKMLEQ